MDTLHHLARKGNMRKVIHWADRREATDKQYRAFSAQLIDLARQYQSRAILRLVTAHMERGQ
jgi:hypothetical protein